MQKTGKFLQGDKKEIGMAVSGIDNRLMVVAGMHRKKGQMLARVLPDVGERIVLRPVEELEMVEDCKEKMAIALLQKTSGEAWNLWRDKNLSPFNPVSGLENETFTYRNLAGANFTDMTFEDCSFSSTNLRRAKLRHTSFIRCDFSNSSLIEAVGKFATFRDCNMFHSQFSDSYLMRVTGVIVSALDPRGYRLVAWMHKDVVMIQCGCRCGTLDQMRQHWGREDYPYRVIGDCYIRVLDAVEIYFNELMRRNGYGNR